MICLQISIVFRKKTDMPSDLKYFLQIFSRIMEGVDTQAKERGYKLMVSYVDEEKVRVYCFLRRIWMEPTLKCLKKIKIPMVILDNYFETENTDCVCINNEQGVFLAVDALKNMGHTRIGYIHSTVF